MSAKPLLLEVDDLRKEFHARSGFFVERISHTVKAVDGVSFSIAEGKTLGLVGESGSGKSTTGYCVLQLMKPTSGSVKFEGRELIGMGREEVRKLRREMQIVFQDPYSSLNPRMTVGDIVGEPLLVHGVGARKERGARVRELLDVVGFNPGFSNRYPHEFSGGQRQRIGVARALALNPKLIVCDEPVSALDVSIQAQILNLVKDLQRDFGLAYLFISHDLGVVRHIAHDVMIMYLGLAVEHGPKECIFARPLHPYTQALLGATPGMGRDRKRVVPKGELPSPLDPPKGCVFSTRCPHVTDLCRAQRPHLRLLDRRLVACHYAERFVEVA